ncbi:MAG TPA: alpha/beta hydrolase, partial [Kofleriaceae bacterium]
ALVAVLSLAAACGGSSAPTAPTAPTQPADTFTPTSFVVDVKGTGRPVIFIPGLGSPGSVWDGTVAHLGGKYQTHVLTIAGFAGVPPVADWSYAKVHDELVHYIQAKHLDHPIVIGHSLGGVMTLWLAETNSADLGGIVDVDGLPFLAAVIDPSMTEAKAAEASQGMASAMTGQSQEEFAKGVRQFTNTMVTKPADQDMVANASAKSDPKTFVAAFQQMFAKDLRPDLGKITAKVTIVAAGTSQSPKPQLEAGWHTQIDAIKGADFHMVDDARHFVMLDQPEKFYALVDGALK